MTAADMVVRSRRVVTQDGIRPAAIHIRDRRIKAVTAYADVTPGTAVRDAGDLLVMPGLVDTHVHVNEPGRGDWEDQESKPLPPNCTYFENLFFEAPRSLTS